MSYREGHNMVRPAHATPTKRPQLEPELYQFSVYHFDRLIRAGYLQEKSKQVELINGLLVKKPKRNPPHDSAMYRLQTLLLLLTSPAGWLVRCQSGIRLRTSVPEPDLAIVQGPVENYDQRRPTRNDIAVVVEVADTSLAFDQGRKLQMYARAQLPEYWIVNLVDRRIEVHTQPKRGKKPTYQSRIDYTVGQKIPLNLLGTQVGVVPVGEVLPGGA